MDKKQNLDIENQRIEFVEKVGQDIRDYIAKSFEANKITRCETRVFKWSKSQKVKTRAFPIRSKPFRFVQFRLITHHIPLVNNL